MDIKIAAERVQRFILRELWGRELAGLPRASKLAFQSMRTLSLAVHGFLVDRCPLRAAALTLVFIFSLAPAMAVGFSVAKGFGIQERIKPALYGHLGLLDEDGNPKPEGAELQKTFDTIMEYVENTRIEALGIVGTALMLFAAYKVLSSVDKTMNHIWGIRRRRSVLRRAVDYLAILVVAPIMLMLTAVLTASVRVNAVLDVLGIGQYPIFARLVGALIAMLIAGAAFWFLYFFFPNTRVRFGSAMTGAIVAAVLWQGLQVAHMSAQVGVRKYNAIYGTFAAFPIFVAWLQMAWMVILFGAEVSYAHASHGDMQFGGLQFDPSPAYREQLALGAMTISARAFLKESPPPTCEEIAHTLASPLRLMREVLRSLTAEHLLVEVQADRPQFLPAAPLDQITVGRILRAVRDQGDESPDTRVMLERLGVAALLDRQRRSNREFDAIPLLDVAHGDRPQPKA